ncbi:MAG: hypothetical protein QXT39_05460 [Conexivisphaerales archaeon]
MDRKIVFGLIVIAVVVACLAFYYFPSAEKEIKVIRTDINTNFTGYSLSAKPERRESYLLSYKNDILYCEKYVFSDGENAIVFLEELKNNSRIIGEDEVSFKDYEGEVVYGEGWVTVILRKNNIINSCGASEEKNLGAVVEWFIKNYG